MLIYRQQSQLRDLAETDTLTELTNHRGFQQVLRSELQRAALEREPLALVALDLDDFKAINERHGHPFGDGVLQGVGAQLRNAVQRPCPLQPHLQAEVRRLGRANGASTRRNST